MGELGELLLGATAAAAILLGCSVLWSLMPMRWQPSLTRSQQDGVNKTTVEILTTLQEWNDVLEARVKTLEDHVQRQAEVFRAISRFLRSGEAGEPSSPVMTGPSTSSPPSSPDQPRAAPPASRTATPAPATEITSD